MRVEKINKTDIEKFEKHLSYKYKIIFEIGCATGLRVSDIITMKKDVLQKKEPTIKEKKTGKSKRIYIPKKLREQAIDLCANNKTDYIFESSGSHISRQAVHKAFKTASKKAGIEYNIATHTMRKTYANKLLKKGKPYKYIQDKLNHSNLSDTALYIL